MAFLEKHFPVDNTGLSAPEIPQFWPEKGAIRPFLINSGIFKNFIGSRIITESLSYKRETAP